MSLERIDKQLAQINQQIIATKEKIELFNSDDMMGEKAFQQLQSSIQDKASQRDKLKQKLDTLKEQKDSINEDIEIHSIYGHGGIFKTKKVAQTLLAAAIQSPVSVMQTASEGGAWGIAVLARYLVAENDVNLSSYLNEIAFKDTESIKIKPNEKEIESFNRYIERFKKGLPIERLANEQL